MSDTQEALLEGVRKEIWDPINIPSVSYPNRLDLRKTDPMQVSQITPKSGQTGGMVPNPSTLQETGVGFPGPEVTGNLYKQPLAPITEQMHRAKLGAALGKVPIPEKQDNLPTPQYPGEPMGKPQVYGGGLTDEMPKDEIDTPGEKGDVIINNKGMIRLGLLNFKEMTGEAIDVARRLGFSIESRLDKLNRKDITDLLVSKGEGRVPRVLAKIIGLDRLRKINDRGKEMIVAEEKAAAQQKEKQKYTVKKGGVIPEKKAFGDVVEGKKSLNELEPHQTEFITNAHQVVNEVNADNIIPSPVILSMIALETGYGTSRFANEGNNWLSLKINKPDQEFLTPKEDSSKKVRSFNNPAESIQAFLDMVNGLDSYAPVRDMLAKYAAGEASEHDIIDSIASTKYAEDPEWSKKVKDVYDGRIKNMFIEQKAFGGEVEGKKKSPYDPWIRKELHEGEIKYFNDNPKVGGMAADDNMIILNPNPDKDINMDAVTKNEFGRVLINTGKFKVPDFKLTDRQQKEFINYGTDKNIQDTIITRIVSGDSSALDFTSEQKAIADKLELVIQQQVQ